MNKIILFLILSISFANAQSIDSIQIVVNKSMEEVLSEEVSVRKISSYPTFDVQNITVEMATKWIDVLTVYENSENYFVRDKVYLSYLKMAKSTNDSLARRLLVNKALSSFRDLLPISNTVPNYTIFEKICRDLTTLQYSDFDDSARNKIISTIQKKQYVGKNIFLIVGWLNLRQTIPSLKNISINSRNKEIVDGIYGEERRHDIEFSLARMGEKKSIDYVYNFLQTEKKKRKGDYFGLNDLIHNKYTSFSKQPEILNFLLQFLEMNEFWGGGSSGEQIDEPKYIACDALNLLEVYYPELSTWLIENNFFDKKNHKTSEEFLEKNRLNAKSLRVQSCDSETFREAKKWILKNQNRYQFNRYSFF